MSVYSDREHWTRWFSWVTLGVWGAAWAISLGGTGAAQASVVGIKGAYAIFALDWWHLVFSLVIGCSMFSLEFKKNLTQYRQTYIALWSMDLVLLFIIGNSNTLSLASSPNGPISAMLGGFVIAGLVEGLWLLSLSMPRNKVNRIVFADDM